MSFKRKAKETLSSSPSMCPPWYDDNKNQFAELPKEAERRKTNTLEKCQFIKLHYRKHLGLFKKIFGFGLLLVSLARLIVNEVHIYLQILMVDSIVRSEN